MSFTLDARGAVIAARMLRASGVTAFDESVLHIVSTLRLGPVPRRLLTPDGTADVTIDVFDGAARGVLLPRIAISQPDADESVGLRLAAPEPGGLTVTNTTPHDLELSTGLIIWRFVGGTDPGWWLPWHRAELVATCEPAQPPRCVTIRPGESLTIVPWRFMACGGQCLHATMCRSNEYYPQGQFRFTVRACDESWEVESPPFEPPIRRRGE